MSVANEESSREAATVSAWLERMFRVEKYDHPSKYMTWMESELAWINERILLAILAEREACASACEELMKVPVMDDWDATHNEAVDGCANGIRMRSNAI